MRFLDSQRYVSEIQLFSIGQKQDLERFRGPRLQNKLIDRGVWQRAIGNSGLPLRGVSGASGRSK